MKQKRRIPNVSADFNGSNVKHRSAQHVQAFRKEERRNAAIKSAFFAATGDVIPGILCYIHQDGSWPKRRCLGVIQTAICQVLPSVNI